MKNIFCLFLSLAFWHSKILMKICIELLIVNFPSWWENLWNTIHYFLYYLMGYTKNSLVLNSSILRIASAGCILSPIVIYSSSESQQKVNMTIKYHSWVKQVSLLHSSLKYFSVFGKSVSYFALGLIFKKIFWTIRTEHFLCQNK